jgi:hypothetical protein
MPKLFETFVVSLVFGLTSDEDAGEGRGKRTKHKKKRTEHKKIRLRITT